MQRFPEGWKRHVPMVVLLAFLLVVAEYVRFNMDRFFVVLFFSRLFFQIALGVTVIAIARNIVGIRALGTFAPVIVAIAFLQTGPFVGLLLMMNIVAVAVLVRQALRGQRMQQAHRVAVLVVLVCLAVAMLEVLGEVYHFTELSLSFLFPVLITAWFGERYVERVERLGWRGPSVALFWTVAVVLLAWAVMAQEWLVLLMIRNPEVWALLVAANWAFGTRVRYRITERLRFRPVRDATPPAEPPGYLTINVRNRDYVSRYNPAPLFPALTKWGVKERLVPAGIPMPRTLLIVRKREELPQLEAFLDSASKFALKPASSLGGEGIVISSAGRGGTFRTNEGLRSKADLIAHARRVLDGEFGTGPGQVLVEELVEQDPVVAPLAPEGLADVRVLSFLGHPVMAMLRLPTRESKGRANLHAGGIGCGVDLRTGRVTGAMWYRKPIKRHPDTGVPLIGFEVPRWPEILDVACHAQDLTGLGFAGVDVVLDASRGPLVLEVNKRPGLEIQNVNLRGLIPRLRAVEGLGPRGDVEERIRAALQLDAAGWRGAAG